MTRPTQTLGIDFGTSNSAAGILLAGTPHLIEIEPGEKTLPTSVFFDFDRRQPIYGSQANAALINGDEGRFMRALKSILGTSLMREKRQMLGERIDFIDIISSFLKLLKTRAEEACYCEFDTALSGRPVLFHSDSDSKNAQAETDLRDCYLAAGFKDVRFMYEPEAAALANHRHMTPGSLGLIVDIGGGTSDFTVFRLAGNAGAASDIDILASHGVRIGGTDFDRRLSIDNVMPLLGRGSQIRDLFGAGTSNAPNGIFHDLATWQKIQFQYNPDTRRAAAELEKMAVQRPLLKRLNTVLNEELGHDIAFAVERGKIHANTPDHPGARIDLRPVERHLGCDLSHGAMTQSLTPLAKKIESCAVETLALAGVSQDQIGSVILVGGSSLMGIIENTLCRLLPRAKVQRTAALTAVVDGLAMASATAFE
jgi:hypothetical chaperone protein